MKYITLFLAIFLISCKTYKRMSLDSLDQLKPPPGTVQIAENLFMDVAEKTNFNWLEYQYWMKRAYGENSDEYKSTQIDQSVWKKLGEEYASLDDSYLGHPRYRSFPVVGISYQQAQAYSKWRSDRVMEHFLIQKGLISYSDSAREDDLFSIEKYFTGQYLGYKPSDEVKIYPEYSLPDSTNFFSLNYFADSVNLKNHKSCSYKENTASLLMNCIEDKSDSLPYGQNPTLSTFNHCKKTVIHHLKGNVREMTNTESEFYGLSFIDSCKENHNKIQKDNHLINSYTGFRNVCVYKVWED